MKYFTVPWRDLMGGLDQLLARNAGRTFATLALGVAVGWWLYVPAHELLHAAACLASGGEVQRLEIAPLYGGILVARVVPFVVAGGEYAGRLSGFDTGGSDLRYLATDLGPFVLTLFPGVWLLRRAARRRWPLIWGMAVPLALAPFLSLTGDAYEIGSIVTTNLPAWKSPPELRSLVRGDDVALVVETGWNETPKPGISRQRFAAGALLAMIIGVAWAFATYSLASWLATRLREPPSIESPRRTIQERP